jgi:cytochrome c556
MNILLRMVLLVCCGAVACSNDSGPEMRPTTTIKDIMDSIVDPSADALWESVATIVTLEGTEERAPKTDEEWAAVRRHAVRLVEASNLLLIKGRHVAKPGEKSEKENIELAPEEIESLINKDRATFERLAAALHDAALPALRAIDAKNAKGLADAGEGIDVACENCHMKYWYPNGGVPQGPVVSPRRIGENQQ